LGVIELLEGVETGEDIFEEGDGVGHVLAVLRG